MIKEAVQPESWGGRGAREKEREGARRIYVQASCTLFDDEACAWEEAVRACECVRERESVCVCGCAWVCLGVCVKGCKRVGGSQLSE